MFQLFQGNYIDYFEKIKKSTTLYVGNLNLVSTEADIHKRLSEAGNIKNIIMGLNQQTLSFAGFCFIEFVQIMFTLLFSFCFNLPSVTGLMSNHTWTYVLLLWHNCVTNKSLIII